MKPSASSAEASLRLPAGLSGKFQRDQGGDGVARSETDAAADAVGVADDEGDGHGFAERPAEAEHDAADHGGARVGQHHAAHHLPGGGAEAVGALLVDGRHLLRNTSRMVAAMKGRIMIARISAGGEDAGAEGRGDLEQGRRPYGSSPRVPIGGRAARRPRPLWDHHEEAPHAVDDGGHGGQQLDRRSNRPAQPGAAPARSGRRRPRRPAGTARRMASMRANDQCSEHRHGRRRSTSVTGFQTRRRQAKPGPKARKAGRAPMNRLDDDGAEQHQHQDARSPAHEPLRTPVSPTARGAPAGRGRRGRGMGAVAAACCTAFRSRNFVGGGSEASASDGCPICVNPFDR